MTWYKISLTQDQVEEREIFTLRDRFHKLFLDSGCPKNMALFSTPPLSKNDWPFYLSPACLPVAESLIASYSGVPCEKPKKEEFLSCVAGDGDAIDLLE